MSAPRPLLQCTAWLRRTRPTFRRSHLSSKLQTSRPFHSTQRVSAIVAAPEIDFTQPLPPPPSGTPKLTHSRIIPASPSYFSGSPRFIDRLLSLQALLRKHQRLPTIAPSAVSKVLWMNLAQYRTSIRERVPAAKYSRVVDILKRLNRIHPAMVPEEVKTALEVFTRSTGMDSNMANSNLIDEFGRTMGRGGRKASRATVYLVEGNGEVLVNGKSLNEAFFRVHDRESAIWPLKVTDRLDKYNVWASVHGGGKTGQAESITLALGRALMMHEPALKPALRRAGCVTRDPRRVERKKPGKLKARKMPAWVKR